MLKKGASLNHFHFVINQTKAPKYRSTLPFLYALPFTDLYPFTNLLPFTNLRYAGKLKFTKPEIDGIIRT